MVNCQEGGLACILKFRPAPGLKWEHLVGLGSKQKNLISASAIPRPNAGLSVRECVTVEHVLVEFLLQNSPFFRQTSKRYGKETEDQTIGNTFRFQVIRIRQKIEENCRSFLDIFSSAIMNDLTMTFTSRLRVDAKCANQ